MFELSTTAGEVIKTLLKQQDLDGPVRIFLDAGCHGAHLGMGVDEQREGDLTFEAEGIQFVMEPGLAEQTGAVKVDYVSDAAQPGFTVSSEKPIEAAGGCGSCTSC